MPITIMIFTLLFLFTAAVTALIFWLSADLLLSMVAAVLILGGIVTIAMVFAGDDN